MSNGVDITGLLGDIKEDWGFERRKSPSESSIKYSVQILFFTWPFLCITMFNKINVIDCAGAASLAATRTMVDQPSNP